MGFYSEQIVPRMVDVSLRSRDVGKLRRRACDGLAGDLLEIGFGSGLNLPYYPASVRRVAAVDPSGIGWKLAQKRLQDSSVPVELSGLDGESLPFQDGHFDSALSTFTLCTIPDVAQALAEVHRVLRAGGSLHFVEHGLAPDPEVQRWQRRLEPMQKRFVGGCHLTRPIVDLVTAAGFTVTELDVFYGKGAPRFGAAYSLGVAVR